MTRPPGAAGYLSRYLWFGVYDNTSIGWNYLCIFDAKYKFRTILLQIIWALVSTATLNPFELGVIYFEKTSQKAG